MKGSIHKQRVRCGKSNCRCNRGELHGDYYYYFFRENGRLRKRYVKSEEVKQIAEIIEREKKALELRRRETKSNRASLALLREKLREIRRGQP